MSNSFDINSNPKEKTALLSEAFEMLVHLNDTA